ncbi:MAG: hypothetical protein ACO1SV_12435 [Fimbriimonas sp.]
MAAVAKAPMSSPEPTNIVHLPASLGGGEAHRVRPLEEKEAKRRRSEPAKTRKVWPIANISEDPGYTLNFRRWRSEAPHYLYRPTQPLPGWPAGTDILVRKAETSPLPGRMYVAVRLSAKSGPVAHIGVGAALPDGLGLVDLETGLPVDLEHTKLGTILRIVGFSHYTKFPDGPETWRTQYNDSGFEPTGAAFRPAPPIEIPAYLASGDRPTTDLCHLMNSLRYDLFVDVCEPRICLDYMSFAVEVPITELRSESSVPPFPEGAFALAIDRPGIRAKGFGWPKIFVFRLVHSREAVAEGNLYVQFERDANRAMLGFGDELGNFMSERKANVDEFYLTSEHLGGMRHFTYPGYDEAALYGELIGIVSDFETAYSPTGYQYGVITVNYEEDDGEAYVLANVVPAGDAVCAS